LGWKFFRSIVIFSIDPIDPSTEFFGLVKLLGKEINFIDHRLEVGLMLFVLVGS
jgi:hypothetical protein